MFHFLEVAFMQLFSYMLIFLVIICVRHYAGRKIVDVSVAQPETCHHRAGEGVCTHPRQVSGYPRPLGTPSRQLSGPIVASFGLRHRDTPKFCVRLIFDIYLFPYQCPLLTKPADDLRGKISLKTVTSVLFCGSDLGHKDWFTMTAGLSTKAIKNKKWNYFENSTSLSRWVLFWFLYVNMWWKWCLWRK